jgi:molecular chaperone DnaK
MSHAIGIDLGTTNTVVAAVVDGVAITLEDEQQRRLLPSIVSFDPSGTVLVGDVARDRQLSDPGNTIFSVKTLIGRPFDSEEVKAARGRFPFRIMEGAKNSTMVQGRDVAYALPEISAFVLRRAKAIAERALGGTVDRAVITVPANFNDLQRASTKIAGKLAGLEVMRILNEPTAAALAYGQSIAQAEKIAIYDLGGGTFDITLLDLTGNVFEVLATAGDTALGGDDIDRLLAERISREVFERFKYDPRKDPVAFARLRLIAEEVKKQLSEWPAVDQPITGLGHTEAGAPITMTMTISRDELERIALPLFERTVAVARESVSMIGLHPKDFDRVILVGGSTRMPIAARMVEELFEKPPHRKVNPDEVVALGAAIQAHSLNRAKSGGGARRAGANEGLAVPRPVDVPRAPPMPQGMSEQAQATPNYIAFSKSSAVITFSPPPPPPGHPATSPQRAREAAPAKPAAVPRAPLGELDDAAEHVPLGLGDIVASGDFFPSPDAFARGSAIETSERAPLLIDVTPMSLRIETVGGYSDVLITANTAVPCEKARTFLTASDNQTVVFIRVAQGESVRFAENMRLGELELSGLKPARRGELKIVVTFELDADGILKVRAREKDTDRETKATMRLLGTSTDAAEVNAMAARQADRVVV